MENDFKIILEAMIDNSSLTNVQKQLAKERLKINADISVEDFAKSKQEIEKQISSLAINIKNILGNAVSDKQASQWAKQYYDNMISGAKQAAKEQEKLNDAQKKNTLAEQSKYYQKIIENNRTIYSLKNKLLTADTEQTAEIEKQIKALEQRNSYNSKQLSKKGLSDNSLERSVNDSKVALENQLKINTAKQTDIKNTNAVTQAEKERVDLVDKLAKSYQSIKNLEIKKDSLDTSKNSTEIAELDKQIQQATSDYNSLLALVSKNTNFDSSVWNETKTAIDAATKSQIEYNNAKQKDALNSTIDNEVSNFETLKIKWDEQGILVGEFKTKVEQLETSLGTVGSKGELDGLKSQIQNLKTEASQLAEVNKIQLSLDNGTYDAKYNDLISKTQQWSVQTDKVKLSITELHAAYDNLSKARTDQEKIETSKQWEQAVKSTTNAIREMNVEFAKDSSIESLNRKITDFYQKNSAVHKNWGNTLKQMMAETASGASLTNVELEKMEQQFYDIQAAARQSGKLGLSFTDSIKEQASKLTQWVSISGIIMQGFSKIREATTELKELDNILTEISKTSDLTVKQIKELGLSSYDTASKYGRTASDYLAGVQSMSQSGFYGEKGTAMAEQSLLAQAAGDMSQEIADKYVLATNAAYKFNGEAEKLNEVLDGQNSISNRNSVALEDMATAMSEAGTVASSYHVAIEDLSAMIGTMESVTKSGGDEVGNAIKSILINLQNVTSSKITNTLEAANASMTEFVNGTEKLRNPIEILRDLAKTFNELDEDDPLRAEILTNVGGKYQAAKLAALLQNMDMFDKMLVDYSEGSGSALEEAQKSATNLSGSLNTLSNSWTELVNTFINADELKAGVNFLNSLVQGVTDLTNALTPLGTLATGIGLFAGIKNVGYLKMPVCPLHI